MDKPDFIFEIIMETWPEWSGNELYADAGYAKFCAVQDYKEAFYNPMNTEEEPGNFSWDFVCTGLYHLYEDGSPTDVSMKVRHVNTLGE